MGLAQDTSRANILVPGDDGQLCELAYISARSVAAPISDDTFPPPEILAILPLVLTK